MKNRFGISYGLLMGAVGLFFTQFVACGAEMYQVSMESDYDSDRSSEAAYVPNSPSFGIHSPNGWTKLPINFRVGAHLSEDQINELRKSVRVWEIAVGKSLFIFEGKHQGIDGDSFKDLYSSLKDSINGNYLDENWGKTGKPEAVLATTIWTNEDSAAKKIATADIRFNLQNYILGDSYKLRNIGRRTVVDMQSVGLHELGHLLGLTHVDAEHDRLSIMNPTLYIGEGLTSRRISKGDIERIQKIYGCEGEACNIDATFDSLSREADLSETGTTLKVN